jgi:phosphoribosylformylglycinamidine cyclo-ligase
MATTYRDAGVDIDAGERFVEEITPMVKSTLRPEVIGSLGGFSGLFSLDTGRHRDPLLVASTDGVGTKLKVATLAGNHQTVGIDLVAMCVNDIVVCGAEPLFFLDYFATARLDVEQGKQVVAGIAEGCRRAGCALLGGETAEMPGFYQPGEYDLAGFAVGVVERDRVLGTHRVKEGDALLGLASSGLHSNGFSLVRKVLVEPEEKSLGGALSAVPAGLSVPLKEELLRPTRIYAKLCLELARQVDVHALAHITGGGLPGNLPRALPENLKATVQKGSWTIPPVFQLVKQAGPVDEAEMLKTFNLGLGMVVVLAPDDLEAARQTASEHGVESWPIGRVEARGGSESRFALAP